MDRRKFLKSVGGAVAGIFGLAIAKLTKAGEPHKKVMTEVDILPAKIYEALTPDDWIAISMHNILAKIAKDKKDRKFWQKLGYGKSPMTVEEIVGVVLKRLAENGSYVAQHGDYK